MTKILDHTKCELGEGPSYDPNSDRLWWFDIVNKQMLSHSFADDHTHHIPLPFMASMSAMIDDETQLIAAEDGLHIRNLKTGLLALQTPLESNNSQTRSNDGRVHASGALWIGTMGKQAQKDVGSIYWFYKGEIRQLFTQITIPNAICFSPDNKTAYFTDTAKGKLMKVAIDPANALPLGEPQVLHDHRSLEGGMDGAIVDKDGVIWNACWGASNLIALSPEGQIIQTIKLPVSKPTCPAFVGKKLDRISVTSAWQGEDEVQAGSEKDAGKTFILDIEVKGLAEPRVKL